jgi:hypothetical protein
VFTPEPDGFFAGPKIALDDDYHSNVGDDVSWSSAMTTILPGVLMPVGTVKYPNVGGKGTAPAAPGTPAPGSGFAVALSDGRTPGKTPASEEYLPVDPAIVGYISQLGAILDKSA